MAEDAYRAPGYDVCLFQYKDTAPYRLKEFLVEWKKDSWLTKLLLRLNRAIDWDVRNEAIKDLISAHENPDGEIGKRVFLKLEGWRTEQQAQQELIDMVKKS